MLLALDRMASCVHYEPPFAGERVLGVDVSILPDGQASGYGALQLAEMVVEGLEKRGLNTVRVCGGQPDAVFVQFINHLVSQARKARGRERMADFYVLLVVDPSVGNSAGWTELLPSARDLVLQLEADLTLDGGHKALNLLDDLSNYGEFDLRLRVPVELRRTLEIEDLMTYCAGLIDSEDVFFVPVAVRHVDGTLNTSVFRKNFQLAEEQANRYQARVALQPQLYIG